MNYGSFIISLDLVVYLSILTFSPGRLNFLDYINVPMFFGFLLSQEIGGLG